MKTRNWVVLSGLVFIGFGIMIFRPVPIPDEMDCLSIRGTVSEVYEGVVRDVIFEFEGLDKIFFRKPWTGKRT